MRKTYRIYLMMICMIISSSLFAQKRPLGITETAENWPAPRNPVITDDGNYFAYTIYNQPQGSSTLVIRAVNSNWKRAFTCMDNVSFTHDSRRAIFMKGDSLCLLPLGSSSEAYIPGVVYFQLFRQGKAEWLAVQKAGDKQELMLRNLQTGEEKVYTGISQFQLCPTGNAIILNKQQKTVAGTQTFLYWLSIPAFKMSLVTATQDQLSNFTFDEKGSQLAFISSKTAGTFDEVTFSKGMPDDISKSQIIKKPLNTNTIMRYQPGMNAAKMWVNDQTPGITGGLKVGNGNLNFSKDAARLFFKLSKTPVSLKIQDNPVQVEVWNYKDAFLQPEQQVPRSSIIQVPGPTNDYVAVINNGSKKVIRLQQTNDYYASYAVPDKYIIVDAYDSEDYNPQNNYRLNRPSSFLVDAANGTRTKVPGNHSVSPTGKYQLYFDPKKRNYFTYEINSGRIRNVSKDVPVPIWQAADEGVGSQIAPFGSVTWLNDDDRIVIPDEYDLWLADPKGVKAPICVTNGYGRKHGLILRMLKVLSASYEKGFDANADMLLFGYNESNKDRGYFRKKLGTMGDPDKLTIGPYNYSGSSNDIHGSTLLPSGMPGLVKAKDADVFILSRESEKEAPDLFLTKDFKEFLRVTDIQPHKNINWLTTELISWKKFDGNQAQGILYKPEDFDPAKKYPVIIWYYEKNAAALHSFLYPSTSSGDLNIPNFVSNGYLVFVPDIAYKIGAIGESAYNSVVSGAQYLAQRPFVDGNKIGITGHSFGGFETNYLVTRTSMFAAALTANGPSNFISFYGALGGGGGDRIGFTETGQPRMGSTLWEDPVRYIKNSPIFQADKVTTPLLLMHTKLDGAVPWGQAVEFFTTLRRLNKKVWLLQYDNEAHTLRKSDNRKDFTIRMLQFFDHYLKGAAAPEWMLHGIPAKLKGVDDGLDLDTTGATPGPGLLIRDKKETN